MQPSPPIQISTYNLHPIRHQIMQNLNFEYKTKQFTQHMTFQQMINVCSQSLKSNLYPLLYQVSKFQTRKYGFGDQLCSDQPFQDHQKYFLSLLAQICEKIIQMPDYKWVNQINKFAVQGRLNQLSLSTKYRRWQLNFRYINIKQAMVYMALSQCNVWYTICKSRRKSQKQFDLDPLIEYFNNFVKKWKLDNPYHIDILPKKQVKHIQKKINQQKVSNPLFQAVTNQDHDLVRELLLKGAKIQNPSFLNNRQKTEVRCAHRACLNGDLRMCKLLDSFGVNWQSEDSQKMTPLFYAIQSSSLPVIKYLVQQIKVNIEKQQIQSRTPFYWACTQGEITIIDYFYKAGCNINQKSQLGRTALSKSCYLGRRDIVLYLLKCKQIDMFSKCTKGRTALHNAVFGPKGGREGHKFGTNDKDSPQCAQILLQNGMDVDIQDKQLCTPLHVAMSSQAIDSIRLLLAYHASLTAKNEYEQTPLMTGAKFGHVQACRILCEQYGADIMCLDKFGKNLLLLTAKFQQNSEDGSLNPAYTYFLQPFIKECKRQNKLQELYRTFKQIVSSQFAQKMLIQSAELWKAFKKNGINLPQLSIIEVENILKVSIKSAGVVGKKEGQQLQQQQRWHYNYLNFATQVLKEVKLPPTKLYEIHMWLLKINEPKILQFVHDNQLLWLDKMEINPQQFFQLFENDEIGLKQKVVSFCFLSLNFDWVSFRTKQNMNILHLLVRKQRSGCIVQLFKALSGKIPQKMLTNKYINSFSAEQQKKVIKQLLEQKEESGLDAHQLSLVLKNKSVAKLIEQKLKEQHFEFSSVLDVKQYRPVLQTDPKQLQIFANFQHQKEEELSRFQDRVVKMSQGEVMEWWDFRKQVESCLQYLHKQNANHQAHQKFWKQIQDRPLFFLKSTEQLQRLTKLSNQRVIGIDIQYFTFEGITMISILQLSSLAQDYIIDCLNVSLQQIKKAILPILYNPQIVKIMHGADNDIVLLKSLFNLSLINFVDTSRLDIELRETGNDLRGLATLVKEYLGANMSKQYQVSEWRIRPIPKAMLQYAKKDSLILPFLLVEMLNRIRDNPDRIRQFILGGCKQCRRNKKQSQPLLKSIKS